MDFERLGAGVPCVRACAALGGPDLRQASARAPSYALRECRRWAVQGKRRTSAKGAREDIGSEG